LNKDSLESAIARHQFPPALTDANQNSANLPFEKMTRGPRRLRTSEGWEQALSKLMDKATFANYLIVGR
jgi:hypothetical protein